MLDPFYPPIPALQALVAPLCESLHLRTLPLHIHEILVTFLFYHAIFEYVAPSLSRRLMLARYSKLSYESRLRWNMHCASMVQSVAICVLTLFTVATDHERRNMNLEERIWGYTGAAGLVQALATGYFLFDLVVMLRYLKVFGLGMLAHASSCVVTYTIGFRPICNYYGCVFMLYELSTPFLNIHWFFDKLGMTGTRAQLYNGLVLLTVFFSARLGWGAYASVMIYRDVWNALHFSRLPQMESDPGLMRYGSEHSLPIWLVVLYMCGHVTLNSLNVYWFSKMIAAVQKRFVKTDTKTQ